VARTLAASATPRTATVTTTVIFSSVREVTGGW
jgi:hypothetical protein